MLGWFKADAARASFSKRRRRSMSEESSLGSTLIATDRLSLLSLARHLPSHHTQEAREQRKAPAESQARRPSQIRNSRSFHCGATTRTEIVKLSHPAQSRRGAGGRTVARGQTRDAPALLMSRPPTQLFPSSENNTKATNPHQP